MAYGIGADTEFDQYKKELQVMLFNKYRDKVLKIIKYEPMKSKRGLGIGWGDVEHVGRCISLKVDGITTKNTNYQAYKISVKIIHNDLCQSKEWVILNDSKVEILD